MRINSVNFNIAFRNPVFKSSFDDELEAKLPKDDDWSVPSYDSRVTDYLRSSIERKIPKEPDFTLQIEQAYRQFCPRDIRKISDDSYRGETLYYTPQRLDTIKNLGVNRVIDIRGFDGYGQMCINKGLQYIHPDLYFDYYDNPVFLSENKYKDVVRIRKLYGLAPDECVDDYTLKSRKFIEDFKKFTDMLNEGHFYIGCDMGLGQTGFVLLMNETFNPNWNGNSFVSFDDESKAMLKEFYLKLTDKDKSDLGFTDDFDKIVRKKLEIDG